MWVRRQNLKEIKESERGSPVRDGLYSWHRVAAFYCFDIAGLPSLIKLYKRKATLVSKPNEKNEMTKASLLLSQTGTKSHGHAALIHDSPHATTPTSASLHFLFPSKPQTQNQSWGTLFWFFQIYSILSESHMECSINSQAGSSDVLHIFTSLWNLS